MYLGTLQHSFSVIALSETWAKDDNEVFLQMSGYNIASNKRNDKGGGVALHVRNDVIYTCRNDRCNSDKDCYESVFIEISNIKTLNLLSVMFIGHQAMIIRTFNDKF